MRIGIKYDGITERIGGALNLVPTPVGMAMLGMPLARSVQVAQRTGIFGRLSTGPVSPSELASALGLQAQGTALLLDVLVVAGILEAGSDGRFSMSTRTAKWLSPESSSYVGDFVADTANYWAWWDGLEDLVRDGKSVEIHEFAADDPYWRSYITGQYQLAKLSSGAVAKAVKLPSGATSLLDVAGAHGEFSMALCRLHPGLRATIIDLPGSAAIGREIVASCGMSDRVSHVGGDMFEADYGGSHDGALAFNIIHHLSGSDVERLFARIAAALRPGAPLCVLDLYDRPPGKQPDTGSFLGLFFHLTSGADTYSVGEVSGWLSAGGFGPVAVKTLPQLPGLALLRAERTG